MNKNFQQKRNITVIAAILTVTIILCSIIYISSSPLDESIRRYPINLGSFADTDSYKINPQTILSSLDRGQMDVFAPELATPQMPVSNKPVGWRQEDYQKIAEALHRFVWKESLDGWSLYRIELYGMCRDNPSGFEYADFIYYKGIFSNGKLLYTAREIFITPQYHNVSWGGNTNFPRPILGWKSINLSALKVTAENALSIAEENGGKAARLSVQNKCSISLLLSGDTGWDVLYGGNGGLSNFHIRIDPYTGKVTKQIFNCRHLFY